MLDLSDRDMIGSNALGFGSALTESGRGVLMKSTTLAGVFPVSHGAFDLPR